MGSRLRCQIASRAMARGDDPVESYVMTRKIQLMQAALIAVCLWWGVSALVVAAGSVR